MYYSKAIVAGSSTAPTETTKRHQMIGTDLVQFILIFANLKGGLNTDLGRMDLKRDLTQKFLITFLEKNIMIHYLFQVEEIQSLTKEVKLH